MMVVNGETLQGPSQTLQMLLDCGADQVYVARRVAEKIGGIRKGHTTRVNLPDGGAMVSNESVRLFVRIGTYTISMSAVVIDIPSYDVILGLTWFRSANPTINWARSEVTVKNRKGKHKLQLKRPTRTIEEAGLNFITSREVKKMLRTKGSQGMMYFVRTVSDDLPKDIPSQFRTVIEEYKDCFRSELPESLPPKRQWEHTIDIEDAAAINQAAYPVSYTQAEEQATQIKDLFDKGLIRTSSSSWGFPVLFVKKPEGKWRMCIDYRGLNAVTKKNTYPLPRIQDCLDRIGSAKRISKFDLLSGFYQLRVAEESIDKTAFNTRQGKFEFLVMPMGLTNAPATFQTMMNTVLQPYLDKFVMVYLDDIIIFSNSDQEHQEHLALILERLRTNKLYAKPSKCIVGAETVEFCGHIVGQGQLRTVVSKTKLIEEWPTPSNVHEVRQFLGLASYYRRFVRNFATIAAPLSDLLKEEDPEKRKRKNRPITWTAKCQLSFELLKKALSNEPILTQPDFHRPFVIETDASEWAIGCCLLQLGTDGLLHPVAYDGRKLQGAELNYAVQEKELLAIKHALRTWSYYIDNHTRTRIITDHESLKYLKDTKVPSKRLAHWIAEFGTYDLDIQYRPGKEAIVPDAISRRPDFIGTGEAYQSQFNSIRSVDENEWEEALIKYLRTKEEPSNEKLRKAVLEDKNHPPSSFVLEKDTLLYKKTETGQAAYLAPIFRKVYLERAHRDYGHLGWPGLNGALQNRVWWPTIERDVQNQIQMCPACQASKGARTNVVRGPRNTLERESIRLFDQWSIDLIGILPRTYNGNRWIITAIERSTGWPVVKALKDATTQSVMDFIHHDIFAVYGIPNEILTDNGTNLVSEAMETFLQPTKVKHRTTTPYHPQTNGKIERFNGTIGAMLTKYLYGKPVRIWDEYLTQAVFATRIRIHAVSKCSPFYLLYGVNPKLPGDPYEGRDGSQEVKIQELIERHARSNEARLDANKKLVEAAIRASLVRDEQFAPKPDIKVGTYVLVRDENPRKFRSKWYGPYKVIMAAPIGTYALEDCHNKVVKNLIHGNRLLPLHSSAVDERTGQWKSSFNLDAIRSKFELISPSNEVREILEQEGVLGYSYKELAMITKREWLNLQSRGLDSSKIGEGKVGDISYEEAIFKKLQARVLALERREEKEAQEDEIDDTIPQQIPLRAITRSVDTRLQGPMVIPRSNEQIRADVLPNEVLPSAAPSNGPAIVTSERTVHKSQARTPAQELPVAVTTASYVALEDRDLQPLFQGAPNEESGIAIQYSNGKSSSIALDAGSSLDKVDTTSRGKSIAPNEEDKRVDSVPLAKTQEMSRTNVALTRNNRTAYSLRTKPKKKVVK